VKDTESFERPLPSRQLVSLNTSVGRVPPVTLRATCDGLPSTRKLMNARYRMSQSGAPTARSVGERRRLSYGAAEFAQGLFSVPAAHS
jgi:hypothetical protein